MARLLEDYKEAQTKSDKSNIISEVVEYIYQNGRFVKRYIETGEWVYAEPLLCREKVSQTFRDNMAEIFQGQESSSSSSRIKRMRMATEQQLAPPPSLAMSMMSNHHKHMASEELPNIFDVDTTAFASAKPQVQNVSSAVPGTLDLDALTNLLMGGAAAGSEQNHYNGGGDHTNMATNNMYAMDSSCNNQGFSNGTGFEATRSAPSRRSSLDLFSTLSDLFASVSNNPMDHHHGNHNSQNVCFKCFEPTPLATTTAPVVQAAASTLDHHHSENNAGTGQNLWEQLNSMPPLVFDPKQQQQQQQAFRQHQQQNNKRHSLSHYFAAESDWFKIAPTAEETTDFQTSTAYAA